MRHTGRWKISRRDTTACCSTRKVGVCTTSRATPGERGSPIYQKHPKTNWIVGTASYIPEIEYRPAPTTDTRDHPISVTTTLKHARSGLDLWAVGLLDLTLSGSGDGSWTMPHAGCPGLPPWYKTLEYTQAVQLTGAKFGSFTPWTPQTRAVAASGWSSPEWHQHIPWGPGPGTPQVAQLRTSWTKAQGNGAVFQHTPWGYQGTMGRWWQKLPMDSGISLLAFLFGCFCPLDAFKH